MEKDLQSLLQKAQHYNAEVAQRLHDDFATQLHTSASEVYAQVASHQGKPMNQTFDYQIDRIVTSRKYGFLIMLALLTLVLWITIVGANYPSQALSFLLVEQLYPLLKELMQSAGAPHWLSGILIDGVYLSTAWVVSVMLPPMAIFFPLFSLLEDLGYLPRIAFNLDNLFKKVGAHGKQSLTMTMGFGCNASGVVATKIIDSPRERLIAIITNNFSLCNGRWPTQILLATIFLGAMFSSAYVGQIVAIAWVVGIALLGVVFMFGTSFLLTKTLLRGKASHFHLELPPYRPPRFWHTLYTSLVDRTLVVLWRAVVFAAPAGAVIWLICNVEVSGISLAQYLVQFFDEPARIVFGMNGVIVLAYIIAIPANEIVIPAVLMLIVLVTGNAQLGQGNGVLFELSQSEQIAQLLRLGGWTLLTAVNVMLFSLLHNPCSTTIYTIYKETKSLKWTLIATLLPLFLGLIVIALNTLLWRIFS